MLQLMLMVSAFIPSGNKWNSRVILLENALKSSFFIEPSYFGSPVELRFLCPIRNFVSVMIGMLNTLFFPNRIRFLCPGKFFGFIVDQAFNSFANSVAGLMSVTTTH